MRVRNKIWVVLILVTTVAIGSPSFAQPNLLVNPGFEDGGGSYNGWFTFGNGVQMSTPGTDNISRTGIAAAKIYGEFTNCPDFPQFDVGGFGQAFTPVAGKAYQLSGYSYVSSADPIPGTDVCNGNRLLAQIAFFDAPTAGNVIASNEVIIGDWSTVLDQWHEFSVSAPVPAGAARVEAIFLFLQPACDTGSVFVDDVSFSEVTPVTESNILVNPGFDSQLDGWTTFANVYWEHRAFGNRTPVGGAKLFGPFTTPGDVSGMYQAFPASEGSIWTFGAYALTTCQEDPITGTNDNFATAKIVFLDSGNNEIASAETTLVDGTSPLGTWTKNVVSATAPAGTDSVRAYVLFVQPSDQGGAMWVDDLWFRWGSPSGADGGPVEPNFVLYQNVPNPFNPTTRIDFDLTRGDDVDISVYDVAGRRITTLFEGEMDAGPHQVTWDGKTAKGVTAPAGVYWYVLKTSTGKTSRSMVLLK